MKVAKKLAFALAMTVGTGCGLYGVKPCFAETPPITEAAPLKFQKDINTAYDKGLKEGKPVVVFFVCPLEDEECVHCKRLRHEIFAEPLKKFGDRAVFAYVEIERGGERASADVLAKQLFEKLGCTSTPTITILAPNTEFVEELLRIVGYFSATDLAGHIGRTLDKYDARVAAK